MRRLATDVHIKIDHLTIAVADPEDSKKLDAVIKAIREMRKEMTQNFQDMSAQLGRINAATTDLAGDITALIELVKTTMTQAEVDQVKAGLTSAADALEATASQFPEQPTP